MANNDCSAETYTEDSDPAVYGECLHHVCERPEGHDGDHVCRECGWEWDNVG